MQRIFRDALVYWLAFALVVLATSAVSFWLLRSSYAGVSDEAVVEAGIAAHRVYLRSVGSAAAKVLAAEIAALGAVTFGLIALGKAGGRRWSERAASALPRFVALALFFHFAWLGNEARRHPGLFLPILSGSRLFSIWLAFARVLWPLLLAGAIAGWVRLAFSAKRAASVRVFGIAGGVFAIAWFWFMEIDPADAGHVRSAAQSAPSTRPSSTRARPNILLLGVDSLRPDKIDDENTPALARLCRESIYFPNTLVTLPRTAPSWVALLTSLPPLANGVETMFPGPDRSHLAEIAMPAHLGALGYATRVSSEYAGEFFDRVELGFERRSVPRVELEQILGQALLGREPAPLAFAGRLYAGGRAMRRWLPAPLPELLRGFASFSQPRLLEEDLFDGLDASRPWFALLFYSQPHFPYTSSSPFYEKYAVAGSDPALRFGKDVTRGEVRTVADRAQIEGLYRGALAETDRAIEDLLARLASSGELDDTIVVLTADHGEGLYECASCVGHGDNLTSMASLRVPFALRLPARRFPSAVPATVATYVSQLDVYPTLLTLLGVAPLPIEEGTALLSAEGRLAPLPARRVFFAETGEWLWPTPAVPAERMDYPPITALASIVDGRIVIESRFLPVIRAAKHRAAILPPWKLVYRPSPKGALWSLFDIDADPLETRDLSGERPEIAADLRSELVRSVLRFSHMMAVGDFFLTRPPPPPEEYY